MRRDGVEAFKASTASKILLIGSVLYFVSLFLQWDASECVETRIGTICGSVENGFGNVGILNALIVIAILVMEVVALTDVRVDVGSPAQRMQVEAALAFSLVFFTVIKILVNVDGIKPFAFVGLILLPRARRSNRRSRSSRSRRWTASRCTTWAMWGCPAHRCLPVCWSCCRGR